MEKSWVRIKDLNFYSIKVRGKTEWKFMEFISDDNISGISEITDTQLNSSVSELVAKLSNKFRGQTLNDEEQLLEYIKYDELKATNSLVLATAISGIRSAFLDLYSRRMEMSLKNFLCINSNIDLNFSNEIELYANINRSLLPDNNGPVERSSRTFANEALSAVKRGFKTVKCAPFDECKAPFNTQNCLPSEAIIGLERLSGISDVISNKTKLLVDCHSRFDLDSSFYVHDELVKRNVSWFEEPMDPEMFPEETKKIKSYSKIPLAGAEMAYGNEIMQRLIRENILDIVMPDVKFCGGPTEVINLYKALSNGKKVISMHCPSGPISLLTSAHVTSAIQAHLPLEHAIDEVEWRKELLLPNESINNGNYILSDSHGLGSTLDKAYINFNGNIWKE